VHQTAFVIEAKKKTQTIFLIMTYMYNMRI